MFVSMYDYNQFYYDKELLSGAGNLLFEFDLEQDTVLETVSQILKLLIKKLLLKLKC